MCAALLSFRTLNFSFSKVSTKKRLGTLIVAMTCITVGHPSTGVNKTVIYLFTFSPSSVLSQLELLLAAINPTQACHNCSDKPRTPPSLPSALFSISLTFIFILIELNKKIMFDIKSLWTCAPADHCVCLFFHSKYFTLSGVCLLALLGCAPAVTAYLEFPLSICFALTSCRRYAEVRLYFP